MRASADVVIIGGGCMGTSVAYHLARRGVTDVVLVERAPRLGMGSTGRNAGGVRHQFSHEANVRLSIESIRFFEHFAEEVGTEIDFHQDGYLFLLSSDEHVERFRRSVEMQRRLGVDVDWLTPSEAERLAPGLRVDGVIAATFCPRDGIADPHGVTHGFARAARAAGIDICRHTEVLNINVQGGRIVSVETSAGTIGTPVVVNATGPWARRIGQMVGLDIPVLPYRRHIFIARPMGETSHPEVAQAWEVPDSRIMVIDFETTFYFHREGPGILFGMSDPDEPPGFDMTVNWAFLEKVTPVAVRRLPALAHAGVQRAWAGLYEVTPDAMPIIGPAPHIEGFFMINGFSGHGFQHSPAAGRILADLICGRSPGMDITPFAYERFLKGEGESEIQVV